MIKCSVYVTALVAGWAVILLTGCVSILSPSYNYNLAVRNIGKQEPWCSLVASSKGIAHEPGRLIPGATKTIAGSFKCPYSDKWTVSWKTAAGEQFEKTLDLTDKFPRPFTGRLVFTINADNELSFVTESFTGK